MNYNNVTPPDFDLEDKTKECWWCGKPVVKDFCSDRCAIYYFND